jgi:hypothetical protein
MLDFTDQSIEELEAAVGLEAAPKKRAPRKASSKTA